eukprot:Nk52_evm6s258 gene=Nk52_evmTU6s258
MTKHQNQNHAAGDNSSTLGDLHSYFKSRHLVLGHSVLIVVVFLILLVLSVRDTHREMMVEMYSRRATDNERALAVVDDMVYKRSLAFQGCLVLETDYIRALYTAEWMMAKEEVNRLIDEEIEKIRAKKKKDDEPEPEEENKEEEEEEGSGTQAYWEQDETWCGYSNLKTMDYSFSEEELNQLRVPFAYVRLFAKQCAYRSAVTGFVLQGHGHSLDINLDDYLPRENGTTQGIYFKRLQQGIAFVTPNKTYMNPFPVEYGPGACVPAFGIPRAWKRKLGISEVDYRVCLGTTNGREYPTENWDPAPGVKRMDNNIGGDENVEGGVNLLGREKTSTPSVPFGGDKSTVLSSFKCGTGYSIMSSLDAENAMFSEDVFGVEGFLDECVFHKFHHSGEDGRMVSEDVYKKAYSMDIKSDSKECVSLQSNIVGYEFFELQTNPIPLALQAIDDHRTLSIGDLKELIHIVECFVDRNCTDIPGSYELRDKEAEEVLKSVYKEASHNYEHQRDQCRQKVLLPCLLAGELREYCPEGVSVANEYPSDAFSPTNGNLLMTPDLIKELKECPAIGKKIPPPSDHTVGVENESTNISLSMTVRQQVKENRNVGMKLFYNGQYINVRKLQGALYSILASKDGTAICIEDRATDSRGPFSTFGWLFRGLVDVFYGNNGEPPTGDKDGVGVNPHCVPVNECRGIVQITGGTLNRCLTDSIVVEDLGTVGQGVPTARSAKDRDWRHNRRGNKKFFEPANTEQEYLDAVDSQTLKSIQTINTLLIKKEHVEVPFFDPSTFSAPPTSPPTMHTDSPRTLTPFTSGCPFGYQLSNIYYRIGSIEDPVRTFYREDYFMKKNPANMNKMAHAAFDDFTYAQLSSLKRSQMTKYLLEDAIREPVHCEPIPYPGNDVYFDNLYTSEYSQEDIIKLVILEMYANVHVIEETETTSTPRTE